MPQQVLGVAAATMEAAMYRLFIAIFSFVTMLNGCASDTNTPTATGTDLTSLTDEGSSPLENDVQELTDLTTAIDTALPAVDAGTPSVDMAVPSEDMATPVEDMGMPSEDMAMPSEDIATPGKPAMPTPEGKGGCDNQTDIELLYAWEDINGVMMTCAIQCAGDEACATTCVEDASGISEPCAGCFGAMIACTLEKCFLKCLDAESEACTTCQDAECLGPFEECAGLAVPGS